MTPSTHSFNMSNSFRKLFRRSSRKQPQTNSPSPHEDYPPLPTLNTDRRPLTAEGTSASSHAVVYSSALFQDVPYEVRQKILVFAFGERTLHIDLALVRPSQKKFHKETWQRRHARIPAQYATDLTQPRNWAWRGSTCHCNSFQHEYWDRTDVILRSTYTKDGCLDGRGYCDAYQGTMYELCCVGAVGWLLSCK